MPSLAHQGFGAVAFRSFGLVILLVCSLLTFSACASASKPAVLTIADADNDGVQDEADTCPNTGGPQPVDELGCPIFSGALPNVDFPANSADLGRDARTGLDELVMKLQQHPDVVISVEGHTDNRGSGIRNLELSKQRVMAVVRYLVARGIAPDRLRPYGYGEARPRVSNASKEGRAQNRRIEVSVLLPNATEQVSGG